MFAGMAIRMASALRLSREIDGDAIGIDNVTGGAPNASELPFGLPENRVSSREKFSWTEREVRRRTFWACFIMDVPPRLSLLTLAIELHRYGKTACHSRE
jgi:hypothetical protein